ncbi:PQQ-dependent sugar dehydrogenase [Hymenobacter humi]|uniref:PQQ-dependent sugar dehydrogenase n=1 Tax=Hymenobacter humi TaxID=1411620 RepID=A0ABW2UDJ3_9BACT
MKTTTLSPLLAVLFILLLALAPAWAQPPPGAQPPPKAASNLSSIKLPKGFRISYFAQNVPDARELALGPDGTVYVGTSGGGSKGKVYALPDKNRDGKADAVIPIASGLNSPNGVAVRQGSLYVAEINRIIRFDNIAANLRKPPRPVVVYDKLPDNPWHGMRYIAFGPDGLLYVPVGAPCNSCEPEKPIFGTINRLRPDGTGFQNVATGVRNTVGFDWHPQTKELWFTDNGRDMLGDNLPADELNRAPGPGSILASPITTPAMWPTPSLSAGKTPRCTPSPPTSWAPTWPRWA